MNSCEICKRNVICKVYLKILEENCLFLISGTISELKRVKTKFGGLPNDGDLQGAAKALNRLQEMYKFNVTQFSRGNILGIQTGAELEAKDTFYLGR